MVQGMTGFGSEERGGFRVEIRSLNHRFMDIFMRMPPTLASHEMPLRDILKERFTRGKFDVYISASAESGAGVSINRTMARGIYLALNELREEFGIKGEVSLEALLNWKELIAFEESPSDTGDLYDAFKRAVAELEDMRLKEGRDLAAELLARADSLGRLNREIISLTGTVKAEAREKFLARVKEFLPEPVEEGRLLQEAAAAAERADISEEVSRLENHLGNFRKILSSGGTIGRKLDFVLQEINREANTIASKAEDQRVLNLVIEMKAEAEKAREQAQNIQ
ncbi:MAG: YicC family protein [Thermodesulfovibrionales bacterium]